MKLWLDDLRPMPEDFHIHVKNPRVAIALLKTGLISEISLDHDLNFQQYMGAQLHEETGYDVARWIEENAWNIPRIRWNLHTANPVGEARMRTALEKADIIWALKYEHVPD